MVERVVRGGRGGGEGADRGSCSEGMTGTGTHLLHGDNWIEFVEHLERLRAARAGRELLEVGFDGILADNLWVTWGLGL